MAETRQFQLTIADKKHDPRLTNPKHMVGNNFHVGNVRLTKGKWTTVNEWWFLKNQALVKKYLDQGQILVKTPDGRTLGQGQAAPSLPPEAMAASQPVELPAIPEPAPVEVATAPTVPVNVPVEETRPDDLSTLPLKEGKLKKLQGLVTSFSQVVAMDVAGLVENLAISPAQAEKVLAAAREGMGHAEGR